MERRVCVCVCVVRTTPRELTQCSAVTSTSLATQHARMTTDTFGSPRALMTSSIHPGKSSCSGPEVLFQELRRDEIRG